jgi:integrase
VARGETKLVDEVIEQVATTRRLILERDDRKKLGVHLLRADIQAHERMEERDAGRFDGEPTDKDVRRPSGVRKVALPGQSIMELFERYKRENAGAMTADTWVQNEKIVTLFGEFVGMTSPPSVVTRKAVRDWKEQLHQWPKNATNMTSFRGLSFRAVIEKNRALKKPTLSAKSINKYLSALSSFCAWLLANDFIGDYVTQRMFLKLDKKEQKVTSFSSEQLQTIFSSPLFRGCRGDGAEHQAGDVRIRDSRYWLALMALFSGARLGELAQLDVADVKLIGKTWCLHFTRQGDRTKSIKTPGSERVVPIHSALVSLGLIDYHSTVAAAGHRKLFAELRPDARGFYSGLPSKFYGRYFKAIGVKTDSTTNFHSFRHTVADAFRRADYFDEQFAPLLGHTRGTTTGRYGVLPEAQLPQRVAMIEAIKYPDLTIL